MDLGNIVSNKTQQLAGDMREVVAKSVANRNYLTTLNDGRELGIRMAKAKETIYTRETFAELALNTVLPKDILDDKYRAYRNAYVVTANSKPGGWDAK